MSDSMWPHRRQPTRLCFPGDSPGKNTGVGCHFLLQCMKVKRESEVAQSCPTLRNPMNCSLLGSSVHGIFQARVLEWVAISFSNLYMIISQIIYNFFKFHSTVKWAYVHVCVHVCILFTCLLRQQVLLILVFLNSFHNPFDCHFSYQIDRLIGGCLL